MHTKAKSIIIKFVIFFCSKQYVWVHQLQIHVSKTWQNSVKRIWNDVIDKGSLLKTRGWLPTPPD